MEFRWNEWNIEHIARHGVRPHEAEWVAGRCSPTRVADRKYRVRGQTEAGRYLQVIYVLDPSEAVFVIHARDLTPREKQLLRRRN